MNKLKIVILLVLFLICTTAGFSLAMGVDHRAQSGTNPSSGPSPIPKNELNYLLLRVNDLTNPTPELVSAWYVKIVFKPEPTVTFKLMYPSSTSSQLAKVIQKNFLLSASHQLGNEFLAALHDMKLEFNGYIITDALSGQSIMDWAGIPNQITDTLPDSSKHIQVIQSQEKALSEALCRAIKAKAKDNPDIDWQSLTGDHIHSSVSTQELALFWQRLTDTPIILCQVIQPR